MSEEIQEIWEAIHALEKRLNSRSGSVYKTW